MLLDRLEAVLNRNVADSRRALALTRQLDGRVMSLTAEGTPVAIFFHAEGGRLRLTPRHESPADASLSGTPVALLALAGPQGEGALRGGGVQRSADGGTSWSKRNRGLPDLRVTALAMDPREPATLYAGLSYKGVYKSVNAGRTWRPANVGIEKIEAQALLVDPDAPATLYLGAYSGGVFRSVDGGDSWAPLGEPSELAELGVVHTLTLSGTTLEAGTGRGIYSFELE